MKASSRTASAIAAAATVVAIALWAAPSAWAQG
jgi:hypothetical protein